MPINPDTLAPPSKHTGTGSGYVIKPSTKPLPSTGSSNAQTPVYSGPTSTVAPGTGSKASSTYRAPGPTRAQKVRVKAAKTIRKKQEQSRKKRSGASLRETKAILKDKAKLTAKQNTAVAPLVAKTSLIGKALSKVATASAPKTRNFHSESPKLYKAAYKRNEPYAKPAPYQTKLPARKERQFRSWVKAQDVPFDPKAKHVDYDMRGYYDKHGGEWDGGHFPDTFKTPYDTSFSRESKYATRDNPFKWKGEDLVDKRTDQVAFSEKVPPAPLPKVAAARKIPAGVRRATRTPAPTVTAEGGVKFYTGPKNAPTKASDMAGFESRYADRPGHKAPAPTATATAKPRKVKRIATHFQKAVKKSQPAGLVPSVVPEKYRGDVAEYGKMLDPVVPKGMTGSEYLGKMIQFESGWQEDAYNPSGASGLGQFMPGTRDTFKSEYGVDPYRSPKEAIQGAAMHASGDYGHSPLYAGYNPGYSDTDPIPSVDGGKLIPTGGKGKPIPVALKGKAKQALGKPAVKALKKGGKIVKDPNAGEKVKGAVPYKQTTKFIVPTESKAEIRSEQRAPARTEITGMNPALQTALVQLAKNTGIPVQINEGYRTEERANDFPSGIGSEHHQGNAADIDNHDSYSAEDLAKVGLNNTAVGGEPWHFQPNDLDASAVTIDTNIPIKGTNLAVKLPPKPVASTAAASSSGTAATSTSGTATAASTAGSRSTTGRRRPRGRRRPVNLTADSTDGYYSVDPETYSADPFLARLAALTK